MKLANVMAEAGFKRLGVELTDELTAEQQQEVVMAALTVAAALSVPLDPATVEHLTLAMFETLVTEMENICKEQGVVSAAQA